jgi:hypothetical protein
MTPELARGTGNMERRKISKGFSLLVNGQLDGGVFLFMV